VVTRGCRLPLLCLLAGGTAGCLLFTDPINTAPTVAISPGPEPLQLVRSKRAQFTAIATDPDQGVDSLGFGWYRDKTCEKALNGALLAQNSSPVMFFQPTDLASGCVAVVVTDNRGATASATLKYEVVNQAPTASITIPTSAGQPAPVPGQPYPLALYSTITLLGTAKDPDSEDISLLTPIWHVYYPADGPEISQPRCPDNSKGPLVCTFATATPGSYRIELFVNDADNAKSAPAEQFIQVAGDQLPNIVLGNAQPLPPRSPNEPPLLLFANLDNTFTINRVEDDGDPYPPSTPSSPTLNSQAGFVWYYRTPTTVLFQRLIGGGPNFTIGKDTFNPQQVVQVRVEYHDRVTAACQPSTPGCDAVFAACDRNATICYSSDLRVQWVTWTVEFR
jgi:hypothetical protein